MLLIASIIVSMTLAAGAHTGDDGPKTSAPTAPTTLPTAHAHNDYRHADPCSGALDLGFASLEVDVFPVDGQLLVGHDAPDLRPDRTIEGLYLEPLRRRCEAADDPKRGPLVDGRQLLLLVDAKRDGRQVLELLLEKLEPLRPWLARIENGRLVDGPIMVALSGSRPVSLLASMRDRTVFADGRIADLDRNPPREVMPLVSGSYGTAIGAALFGPPSDSARRRLTELAERAHAQGRRLRFWGHLEDPWIWSALVDAKVDLIGTDDRERLAAWLRENDPRCGGSRANDETLRDLDSPSSPD